MKIAIFTDAYIDATGGIPNAIRAQADELERQGHIVKIFCPGQASVDSRVVLIATHKELRIAGSPVAKRPEVVETEILKQFPDFGKEYDIIHVHWEASCSLAGMRLAKRFRIPLVVTMHGREDIGLTAYIPRGLRSLVAWMITTAQKRYIPYIVKISRDDYLAKNYMQRKMWEMMVNQANFADVVITPSEHFRKKLEHYGVKRKIVAIPTGVADEVIEKIKAEKKKSRGELRILWNSRISPEKRIMALLLALKEMKEKYFLGVFGDGGDKQQAEKFVAENGINAEFYGGVEYDEMIDKMRDYDVVAMMSYDYDTQGLTIDEAEVMGMPVVLVDKNLTENLPEGGYVLVGEFNKGKESGDFCRGRKPASETEVAAALDELAKNPEKVAKMREVLLKHRDEVRESRRIKRMIGVYRELIEKSP
ncbi:MAG: glycosyltransferase [Candidatus Saccharibacteria bacterium]|nr:glycosyltransferase [Candidatus Saccharibacteria bacterium]